MPKFCPVLITMSQYIPKVPNISNITGRAKYFSVLPKRKMTYLFHHISDNCGYDGQNVVKYMRECKFFTNFPGSKKS